MTKSQGKGEGSGYWRKDGRCIGEYDDTNAKLWYVSGKNKAEVQARLRNPVANQEEGIAHNRRI
jgi:hypothetical protein